MQLILDKKFVIELGKNDQFIREYSSVLGKNYPAAQRSLSRANSKLLCDPVFALFLLDYGFTEKEIYNL